MKEGFSFFQVPFFELTFQVGKELLRLG